ncbi:hypothetical protein EDEG_02481 [Edhazardia aedis USNM 41457]|uniref:18S rRNA cytosine acetyltransferase n=1 Tax=Edhazardia aedis (strain USNM 41457) TaxID=1003232 RepID=J9D5X0_EDHAE|nr:hypothetical protein EDEG_02481 [Edhazardia aedis USNM 41457]|eukprot:EJW03176.1 hypothetical protein EDEG_02481 [Edhazardia aedis USNM 41457]
MQTEVILHSEIQKSITSNYRLLIVMKNTHMNSCKISKIHSTLCELTVGPRPSILYLHKKDVCTEVAEDLKLHTDFVLHKDVDRILGNTFSMLILQDFEKAMPNLVAKAVEAVKGGGIVIFLTTTSQFIDFKSSYEKVDEIGNARIIENKKTEKKSGSIENVENKNIEESSETNVCKENSVNSQDLKQKIGDQNIEKSNITEEKNDNLSEMNFESVLTGRFCGRMYKSLQNCENIIFIDDNYKIIKKYTESSDSAIKNQIMQSKNTEKKETVEPTTNEKIMIDSNIKEMHIKDIQSEINEKLKAKLFNKAKTPDQRLSIETLESILRERNFKTVVSLTASRGRGKSATLGLTIALALHMSFSNIFIASPAVENIATVFSFISIGLESLGYKKKIHYDEIYTTRNKKRYICKVNFRSKYVKQTVQYVDPYEKLCYLPDLMVIDEAACIPIPFLRRFLDANLVFMASTINGYEGTGRSLALKLFSDLEKKSIDKDSPFVFKKLVLNQPIRYAENDPIERWLNSTLLLYATPSFGINCAVPSDCVLYKVNRDILFSYHPVAETFLNELVSIFVASHYKNSPNDLLSLGDLDNRSVFVLVSKNLNNGLPKIIAALEVSYENIFENFVDGPTEYDNVNVSYDYENRFIHNVVKWKSKNIKKENVGTESANKTVNKNSAKCKNENFNTKNFEKENISNQINQKSSEKENIINQINQKSSEKENIINHINQKNAYNKITENNICCIGENKLSKKMKRFVAQGGNRDGNLVPWTLFENYLSDDFLFLKGVRIVRIAVHPEFVRMGYGTKAINLFLDFIRSNNEKNSVEFNVKKNPVGKLDNTDLSNKKNKNENKMLPTKQNTLLIPLNNVSYKTSEYVGTSFGATNELVQFWAKSNFFPVYLKNQPSRITGDFSTICIHPINQKIKVQKTRDLFKRRLIRIVPSFYKNLDYKLFFNLFYYKDEANIQPDKIIKLDSIKHNFSEFDILSLEKYISGNVDYKIVAHLMHDFSIKYFDTKFSFVLSPLHRLSCFLLVCNLSHSMKFLKFCLLKSIK